MNPAHRIHSRLHLGKVSLAAAIHSADVRPTALVASLRSSGPASATHHRRVLGEVSEGPIAPSPDAPFFVRVLAVDAVPQLLPCDRSSAIIQSMRTPRDGLVR